MIIDQWRGREVVMAIKKGIIEINLPFVLGLIAMILVVFSFLGEMTTTELQETCLIQQVMSYEACIIEVTR